MASECEAGEIGMVQKRPFSGNTRDLSADPDRSRALERVYASPWLPCWSFSSARTACTPEVPASERAAHPSATPRDSCRPDWGLHCGGTGGGLGRTEARGMVQKRVTAQGWLGSTPEGQRPQIRGLRAGGSLAVASSIPANQLSSPARLAERVVTPHAPMTLGANHVSRAPERG